MATLPTIPALGRELSEEHAIALRATGRIDDRTFNLLLRAMRQRDSKRPAPSSQIDFDLNGFGEVSR